MGKIKDLVIEEESISRQGSFSDAWLSSDHADDGLLLKFQDLQLGDIFRYLTDKYPRLWVKEVSTCTEFNHHGSCRKYPRPSPGSFGYLVAHTEKVFWVGSEVDSGRRREFQRNGR